MPAWFFKWCRSCPFVGLACLLTSRLLALPVCWPCLVLRPHSVWWPRHRLPLTPCLAALPIGSFRESTCKLNIGNLFKSVSNNMIYIEAKHSCCVALSYLKVAWSQKVFYVWSHCQQKLKGAKSLLSRKFE